MKNKTQLNLYRVRTSYDGTENFSSYDVVADNGVSAGAVINLKLNARVRKTVLKNGKVNHTHEQVDEIERIADDIIIPDYILKELSK